MFTVFFFYFEIILFSFIATITPCIFVLHIYMCTKKWIHAHACTHTTTNNIMLAIFWTKSFAQSAHSTLVSLWINLYKTIYFYSYKNLLGLSIIGVLKRSKALNMIWSLAVHILSMIGDKRNNGDEWFTWKRQTFWDVIDSLCI